MRDMPALYVARRSDNYKKETLSLHPAFQSNPCLRLLSQILPIGYTSATHFRRLTPATFVACSTIIYKDECIQTLVTAFCRAARSGIPKLADRLTLRMWTRAELLRLLLLTRRRSLAMQDRIVYFHYVRLLIWYRHCVRSHRLTSWILPFSLRKRRR